MKRRDFLGGLGVALAWPSVAIAQTTNVPRIGALRGTGPVSQLSQVELVGGLRDHGYVDGRNIAIEFRTADGKPELLPELAAELVRLKVAVIVAYGPQAIQAAKDATSTIPIVMGRMDDADVHGFVTNYARPGGNITGISFPNGELSTKHLEFLKEILPPGVRMAALWDVGGTAHHVQLSQDAARKVGVELDVFRVSGRQDFAQAFAAAKQMNARGLMILGSPMLTAEIPTLTKFALDQRLAAIYNLREFAQAGGLLSYGPSESDPSFSFRHAADFVDRILRGAKPGDLPVEQPTLYALAVNLKTAKELGITIPAMIVGRADDVFE